MSHRRAEPHLGENLHHITTEQKAGTEITCVFGGVVCCSALRSGRLNSSVIVCVSECGGGAASRELGVGLSSQGEGRRALLLILSLGGAGTDSKHFPAYRKSKQKQVHRPGLYLETFLAFI